MPDFIDHDASLKLSLRRELRRKRNALTPLQKVQASQQILMQIKQARLWQKGRRWAFYLPFGSELDCRPLIAAALANGKSVFVPLLRKGTTKRMVFVNLLDVTGWRKSPLGMLEPVARSWVSSRQLDVVCLPLLGFDREGHRLGQGGGYYDATFAFRRVSHCRPFLLGLGYACQQVDRIPTEPWDIRLDAVLTEEQSILCQGK